MKLFRSLLLLLSLSTGLAADAQTELLSPQAQISVITCGPGTDLYATFGHSAFRIRDPGTGIDWVYNYGTFDFNTPNFYLKFARGKLRYALSRSTFASFLYTYQLENRWVREQLLDLTPAKRQELFRFLEINNRPENRYYSYDFLFENCATKIPEVLKETLGADLVFRPDHLTPGPTFRDLIQQNLDSNSWSSLGIDLALGAVIDREARPEEYLFLPEYVRLQLEDSDLSGSALILRERSILDLENPGLDLYFTASPLFWFLVLLVFVITISWIDYRNHTRSRLLDFFLFLTTGMAGILIGLLWFFTDHTATLWNWNILWAFPVNAVAAFYLARPNPRAKWLRPYFMGLLGLVGVCLLLWVTGLQEFHPLLPVIWLTLCLRYLLLIRHQKPER